MRHPHIILGPRFPVAPPYCCIGVLPTESPMAWHSTISGSSFIVTAPRIWKCLQPIVLWCVSLPALKHCFPAAECRCIILISSSNVFVNAAYFDGLTYRIRGVDGLSWWPPIWVLITVCSVWVCVCTALSGIYYSGPSWLQGNFLPVITADITGHSKICNVTQTILNPSVPEIRKFFKTEVTHCL